ncbi:MAG: UvrD-helicase domain-containing protein [Xanthomonadales bacterium]|nr:UvrD-helicase domain-containing protein [Xanthomonadales bacterium]
MNTPAELDWRRLPLSGISLVEASAGTGKTYNIALLYLRLLLEQGLTVQQVLVTTFTEAAAQELKARIRQRLLDALDQLRPGAPHTDPELAEFLRELADQSESATLLLRVRQALADIDLAPISTIHGCCRRILADFPFAAGAPFVLGEIVDGPALEAECVEDYWRQQFLTGAEPAQAAIAGRRSELRTLIQRVRAMRALPAERVLLPRPDALDLPPALRGVDGPQAIADLLAKGQLFRPRASALRDRLHRLRQFLLQQLQSPSDAVFDDLDKLHEYLSSKLPSQADPARPEGLLQHPLIAELRRWVEAQRNRVQIELTWLAARARAFVDVELPRRLALRRQSTFDQLIATVHERLAGEGGEGLAAQLAQAWPAVLIDEFQDTDRRQWEIFEAIHSAARPTEGVSDTRSLILIGDPKQSIYAFRGGDIATYLAVRDALPVARVHSIRRNYRSHPQLLAGLNAVYALAGSVAFADSGIEPVPVSAGDPARWKPLAKGQALQLCVLSGEGNRSQRDQQVLAACADDVAALLAEGQVQPGQIAVLLDTNVQIRQLRTALTARGVPVVGAGRADVLSTEWADDVQLLLHALLHPSDGAALRGALATRLLGLTANDLLQLSADAAAWDAQLDRAAHWRFLWDSLGVLAGIEAVVVEQAPRLLADADGERALTDLRHIGEVLQALSGECFGPAELYARLVALRREGSEQHEAAQALQLRIESEAQRVQLLTVHASKGLEFPWVFLPMAWRYRQPRSDIPQGQARFHDVQGRLWLDLGSPDLAQHQALERQEALAERMRLLYVALTRAELGNRLYAFDDLVPSRDSTDTERGALVVLLASAMASQDQGEDLAALAEAVPELSLRVAADATQLRPPPTVSRPRQARRPLPSVRRDYALYSFTSLMRQGADALGQQSAAIDELPIASVATAQIDSESAHPELLALAAVKGPRFGNAMHRLLEDGRGQVPYVEQLDRIRAALDAEAVRLDSPSPEATLTAMAAMLDRCVETELASGLRLVELPGSARRAEFEFSFSLEGAGWHGLSALLQRHQLGHWWPAVQQTQWLNGLMKGYIDLVFAWDGRYHVLDYKTNFLGTQLSDYGLETVDRAMVAHHYGLQALIYSVALHRYLGRRLDDYDPARQLGESWYLFVRACGLGQGAGVWRRKFPVALIEALDRLFDSEASAA